MLPHFDIVRFCETNPRTTLVSTFDACAAARKNGKSANPLWTMWISELWIHPQFEAEFDFLKLPASRLELNMIFSKERDVGHRVDFECIFWLILCSGRYTPWNYRMMHNSEPTTMRSIHVWCGMHVVFLARCTASSLWWLMPGVSAAAMTCERFTLETCYPKISKVWHRMM